MMRLINGELIKVRTTRTALGFGVASVLLVLALVLISFLAGDPTTAGDKRDALNVGGVLSVPLLIFGIVGATGEYRHRTIAPAVLIAPGRARLTVARLIASAMKRSPAPPTPWSPLTTKSAASASPSSVSTRRCMRVVSASLGRWTPGRSVRTSW